MRLTSKAAWSGVLALGAIVTTGAWAQVGEHGKITTRSDVKMAISGEPGTSGKKLDALASTLSMPLLTIRGCYAELVQEKPDVVGTLEVDLEVPEQGKHAVRMPGAVEQLKPMKACIDKAFAKLDVSQVPRPAGARLTLELTNSAAGAAGEVRKQEADAARVDVKQDGEGSFRSHGQSAQGEVAFDVHARTREAVEQLHTVTRTALPGLFDCRRRASKKQSPEGAIALELAGAAPIKVVSSSVADARAGTCTSAVLKRTLDGQKVAGEVTITFAPRGVRDAEQGVTP